MNDTRSPVSSAYLFIYVFLKSKPRAAYFSLSLITLCQLLCSVRYPDTWAAAHPQRIAIGVPSLTDWIRGWNGVIIPGAFVPAAELTAELGLECWISFLPFLPSGVTRFLHEACSSFPGISIIFFLVLTKNAHRLAHHTGKVSGHSLFY